VSFNGRKGGISNDRGKGMGSYPIMRKKGDFPDME
jgi:hypothetical protein